MTLSSPFLLRGRGALAIVRDERDLSVLERQLDRLGMTVASRDPDETNTAIVGFDVIFVDADIISSTLDCNIIVTSGIPLIALVGTETPSRLKSLLELDPAGFLVKPLRSAGLYSALVLAFDKARRAREMARRMERLEERVRARRVVLAALLEVMRRHDLSEPEAFAWLRGTAMKQRTTIERLSIRLLGTNEYSGPATRRA